MTDSLWVLHYCSRASFPVLPCPPCISLEHPLQWNDVNGHDTNSMQTCNLPQHNLALKFAPSAPLTDPQQWVPVHQTPQNPTHPIRNLQPQREERGQSHWELQWQQRLTRDRDQRQRCCSEVTPFNFELLYSSISGCILKSSLCLYKGRTLDLLLGTIQQQEMIKGLFIPKWKLCHHFLTLMLL